MNKLYHPEKNMILTNKKKFISSEIYLNNGDEIDKTSSDKLIKYIPYCILDEDRSLIRLPLYAMNKSSKEFMRMSINEYIGFVITMMDHSKEPLAKPNLSKYKEKKNFSYGNMEEYLRIKL